MGASRHRGPENWEGTRKTETVIWMKDQASLGPPEQRAGREEAGRPCTHGLAAS